MTARHASKMSLSASGAHLDVLARSVISQVNASPHHRRNRRIDVGTKILLAAVLDRAPFDQDQIRNDLASLRISSTDIVDHCIPIAARELGQAWVDDRLSFGQVTVGSTRLYALCKAVGAEWDNVRPPLNAKTLLLVTIDREDHIIGPAVLTDQLRRRGHSIQLLSNATEAAIVERLGKGRFDGALISVWTHQALDSAVKAISRVRQARIDVPIVLGGGLSTLNRQTIQNAGADLVTNDIEEALDAIAGNEVSLRVAE